MLVDTVYRYRTLVGRCELGLGLEWDEIDEVTTIEAAFAPGDDDRRMATGRRFRREPTKLTAVMRGDRINDRVEVVEIGPGGLVCRHAPYVARGEVVEIVLEIGDESFRFAARGVWLRDDGDDYKIGCAFVGMPVKLRTIALASSAVVKVADLVDKLAA